MENKIRSKFASFILICAFFAGIVIPAFGQPSKNWKGKFSKQGDITIIWNPKEPLLKSDLFLLKEEIAINGNGATPEESFSLVGHGHIAVGPNGRIYIYDMRNPEIKIFDEKGKFVRIFGRKGQGPGEFMSPRILSFCQSTRELFVQDAVRGLYFSADGDHLRNIPLAINYETIRSDARGNIRGTIIVRDKNGEREELRFFDKNGNPGISIAQTPIQDRMNPFAPYLTFCSRKDGSIVEGFPETYEFNIHNPDGTVANRISKETDPIEVTDEWRQAFLKSRRPSFLPYRFPRYQPYYRGIFSDDVGRIYIVTSKEGFHPGHEILDIFDPRGYYLNEVSWPKGANMIENGKLYSIQYDEDGYPIIKRFAMLLKNDR